MKHILVTGDVTADWNIARILRGKGDGNVWNDQDLTRACLQPGGAAMLGNLINEMFKGKENDYQVSSVKFPPRLVSPVDRRTYHSYAMWQAVEYPEKSKHLIWRVESFLGLDNYCGGDSSVHCTIPIPDSGSTNAEIIVIDDAGLQFRSNRGAWPQEIVDGKPEWIIVKMSHPVAQDMPDSLWDYLLEHHAERTIVVTSITDLRKRSVRISKGLSWERTAENLNWEFNFNPALSSLRRCAYVVVSLGNEGAFLLKNTGAQSTADLLYDPLHLEGDWSFMEKGYMLGYNVCLTAAITRAIANSPDPGNPQVSKGVRQGLCLMRKLYREGYGPVYKKQNKTVSSPRFPVKLLAKHTSEESDYFCWRKIPHQVPASDVTEKDTQNVSESWRILNDICRDHELEFAQMNQRTHYRVEKYQELYRLATELVEFGHEQVLKDVPTLVYGDLVTADRQEIEDLRRIATSIVNYCKNPAPRPYCLAVFGAPGSGKSFGIKQMAKCLLPGKIQSLVFNLTQFAQKKDLIDALHQVRDIGLAGKVPLVFWDEFDTEGCQWLKAFLAPMQDGEFQDGQITYHIGKAIFVFAGGTSWTYERFSTEQDKEKFVSLKGPDFLSRLHNFLNISGPNPAVGANKKTDLHIIRRAILIRSLMRRHAEHLFQDKKLDIDSNVLRALLKIGEYKHGARSLEAIITMILASGQKTFNKSSMPPLAQLDIHVNGEEFIFLTEGQAFRRNDMDKSMLDTLAAGVHQVYCEGAKVWKTEAALKNFDELDEGLKEENRRHVVDIVAKLEHIGFIMIRAEGVVTGVELPEEVIETLSEMEHMRWMKSKVNMGWVFSPQRDDQLKHHPCLLPWSVLTEEEIAKLDPEFAAALGRTALPESEKNKDRELVKAIPRILAMGGYILKKL